MGGLWSDLNMSNSRQANNLNGDLMLMPSFWMENDALYNKVETFKDKFEEKDIGIILWMISKFMPCQMNNSKCNGGVYKRITFGWKDNIENNSSCHELQPDRMLDVLNATTAKYTYTATLIFDNINIKGTLEHESKKHNRDRNLIVENILILIHRELTNCIHLYSIITFNIDKIYGAPPFEKSSIQQILLNFCMFVYGNDTKELKRFLIITKFVLRYYDSWIWPAKELSVLNSNQYSESYKYYYQRYMLYCYLPRCVHSISKRYRTSMIFGQDVLRYTLRPFRNKLQIWCNEESEKWSSLTKFYCLDYLPIYLDALEQQLYADKSPIWDKHYELSDYKIKLDSVE